MIFLFCLFQADMSTNLNTDRILNAYEDVRSDGSETEW